MKNFIRLFIFLFIFSLSSSHVNARIIWNVSKSGGLFGGFNKVDSKYEGRDQWNNEIFSLTCSGIGFNGCNKGGTIVPPGSPYAALHNFSDAFVAEVEDEASNEVSLGNTQGSTSRQVAWDKDGDGQYESLVLIDATWDSEDPDFNDGTMIITIDEIDFPF